MLRAVLLVAAVAGANAFTPTPFGVRPHLARTPDSCAPRRAVGVVSLRAEVDGAATKSELQKLQERAKKALEEAEAAEKR